MTLLPLALEKAAMTLLPLALEKAAMTLLPLALEKAAMTLIPLPLEKAAMTLLPLALEKAAMTLLPLALEKAAMTLLPLALETAAGPLPYLQPGISSGDQISQKDASVLKTEEETSPLECTFSTSSTRYWLHWYRQYPGTAPQFILFSGSDSFTADYAKERFSSTADKSSGLTTLTISKVLLEDSALYYCALQHTVIQYWGHSYKNLLPAQSSNYTCSYIVYKPGMILSCFKYTSLVLFHIIMSPVNTPVWNSSHLHHRSRVQLLSHLPTLQFLSSPHSALTQAPSMGRGNQQRSVLTTALLLILIGCIAADMVTQTPNNLNVTEGKTTELGCCYSASSNSPDFFWYIQYPNDSPRFMLQRDLFGYKNNAASSKQRFNATVDKTSQTVPLTIQQTELCDSAVYCCALRPTVTMNNCRASQTHSSQRPRGASSTV
ncbi:UNVERIFIED_CONTAM: hypothetical protein FKN15_017366 [Acipenser sinensis]